jgi:C4-dicarboxylate-specific signal transduction histidine kinase
LVLLPLWAVGRLWLGRRAHGVARPARWWSDALLALSGYLLFAEPPGVTDALPYLGLTLLVFQLPTRAGALAALAYAAIWVGAALVTPVRAASVSVLALVITITVTYLQLLLITTIDRARERLAVAHRQRLAEVEAANAALRASQAQLVQAGKLAAVGTLAAGVSHELNQPLTVIRGQAQLLLERPDLAPPVRDRLRRIEYQTGRMAAIIDHLRAFGLPGPAGEAEPVDLNQVTRAALLFLDLQLRERGIVVRLELSTTAPLAWARPNDIEQIVLHLLTNARDALMATGGSLTIRTSGAPDEERVALVLLDDGPGLTEAVLPRLFEPFFTTKEIGQGRGLGLAVSRGLARRWGGDLLLDNRDDGRSGARALLVLPAAGNGAPGA